MNPVKGVSDRWMYAFLQSHPDLTLTSHPSAISDEDKAAVEQYFATYGEWVSNSV